MYNAAPRRFRISELDPLRSSHSVHREWRFLLLYIIPNVILTGEFTAELRSPLPGGQLIVPCLWPVSDAFQLNMYWVEVQWCCVREMKRSVPCKRPWRPTGRLEKKLYPFINLGTRWEWMVHVMPRPLYSREWDTGCRVGSRVVRAVHKFEIRLVRNDKRNKWRIVKWKQCSNRTQFSQDLYIFLTADASISGLETLSAGQLHSLV
jgi:hypothetical protein